MRGAQISVKGFFESYGFGRNGMFDLPAWLLLSFVLHLALLILFSFSPFRFISTKGQTSFITVDLASAPASPAPAARPAEVKKETPPVSPPPRVEKKPEPSPPPVVEKKVEPRPEPPPPPAKDDVVVKKVPPQKEPVKPAVPREEKPLPRPEAAPPKEAAPPAPVASIPQEQKPAPVETPALPVVEEAGPISALEGAREGVDVTTNYYIQAMVSQITRNWKPPANLRYERNVQPVVVYFKIQKDGRITDISVETSSGRRDLDRSAERAVVETRSIPPLPPNLMKDDTLGVHFKFVPKIPGG